MSGDRTDYSRPLFHDFLSLNFVVCSMDYRLLPETSLTGLMEDVRDVEPWLRQVLPTEMMKERVEVDGERLVVVGASAGGHLALLTPKLWTCPPLAIFSLYAPTNMHNLPYLNRGRLSIANCPLPDCTASLLAAATNYDNPPSGFAIPQSKEDYEHPRRYMALHVFRKSRIVEFLWMGLVRCRDGEGKGELRLPRKGSVASEAIDDISPDHLCTKIRYPPTYQVMGENDEVFDISHALEFGKKLEKIGVACKTVVVEGEGHAFDIWAELGGKADVWILRPAVEWVAGLAVT